MIILFANIFASPLVIQIAIVGGVAALAWWLLDIMANKNQRTTQRLEEIRKPNSRKSDLFLDGKGGKGGAMSKVLEKASPALAKPLQPKTAEEISVAKSKLNQAGFRTENAAVIYRSLKMTSLLAGFFLAGGAIVFTRGWDTNSVLYTTCIALGMFFIPDLVLKIITKLRQDCIFYGLPDALDLMVVCMEAGLGLDQAMRKVADEMKESYHVLADEFALCNLQLQVGKARNNVLRDLGFRSGVEDLQALAAILIQADKFGSSVAQALRVQSDSMRTRRRQMAEEKAAKTAVKLIFPLVIFIFPAIFIVLVGPAAITMINQMFPVMGG